MQIGQVEFVLLVFFQVVEAKAGEIGDQHVLGQVALQDAGEIVQRLGVGPVEVFAARLVLDQQHAFPEQVDEALLVAELFDRLLKRGEPLATDAEDIEKAVPEGFGFGVFGGFVLPIPGRTPGRGF